MKPKPKIHGTAAQLIDLSAASREWPHPGAPVQVFSRSLIEALPESASLRHYAALLGVSLAAVQQWMKKRPSKWHKALPFTMARLGSLKFRAINKADLLKWMEETGRLA